jgi:hypothetical protein
LPDQILALCRPDRAKPHALERALALPQVQWGDAPGQADVVEVKPDKAEHRPSWWRQRRVVSKTQA